MTRRFWSFNLLMFGLVAVVGGCSEETAVETNSAADVQTVALAVEGMT